MWRRIQTKDRLARIGIQIDQLCSLCHKENESLDHLFFGCDYTSKCCNILKHRLNFTADLSNINKLSQWLVNCIRGRFKKSVVQACFSTLLYMLWKQRNDAIWKSYILKHEILVDNVLSLVRIRILGVMPRKTSQSDRDWFSKLMSLLLVFVVV